MNLPEAKELNWLQKLTHAAKVLAKQGRAIPLRSALHLGDPEVRPDPEEIEKFVQAFDGMALSIQQKLEAQRLGVATAAHDLSGPLAVLCAAAREMKNPDISPQEREERLNCVLRNATSLQYLVEDLRDTVRQDQGPLAIQNQRFNLAELASQVVADYADLARSHNLVFEGEKVWVEGDPEYLRRLMFNLISNAVKFSERGTQVKVEVWQREHDACLFVHDQGRGLNPVDSERLFLPFTRLDTSESAPGGDGLGLASVKRIAVAHGASLLVQGSPGKGCTFEVCFKAAAAEGTSLGETQKNHSHNGSFRLATASEPHHK